MKTVAWFVSLVSVLCLSSVWAGSVCTWSGKAGDGKWSTDKNWDTPPVSGNGDELVFDTSTAAIVTENDREDFDIAKITVSGGNALTVNGKTILLKSGAKGTSSTTADMTTVWSSGAANVTLNAQMKIEKDYCIFEHSGGNASVVVVNGDCFFGGAVLRLRSTRLDGTAGIVFKGEVSAPNGLIHAYPFTGGQIPYIRFEGKISAKEFGLNNYGGNWGASLTVWSAKPAGSAIKTLDSGFGMIYLQDENVFAEDGELKVLRCDYGDGNSTTLYANQRVKRLMAAGSTSSSVKKASIKGSADNPTLTVADDADETLDIFFDNALNLTWAPLNANTLTLKRDKGNAYNHTMSGTLTVEEGRVVLGAGVTFASLSKLMLIGNSTFEVGANDADPLNATVAVFADSRAKFVLKSDCTVGTLVVGGQTIQPGTYSSVQLPSVISDDSTGSLTVTTGWSSPDYTYWTTANGDFSTAANWSAGVPSAALGGWVGLLPGTSPARITTATAVAGAVTVDGYEGATAVLETSADAIFTSKTLTLGANGQLNVTAGRTTVKGLTTVSGSEVLLSGNAELYSEKPTESMSSLTMKDACVYASGNAKFVSAQGAAMGKTMLRDLWGASAGKTCRLELTDHAAFSADALTSAIGMTTSSDPVGGKTVFDFSGDSAGAFGSYVYIGRGANGTGELCISGRASVSNKKSGMQYCTLIGCSSTDAANPAKGVMRVSGGCYVNECSMKDQNATGFAVGWGVSSDSGETDCNSGELYLSGGAITNRGGGASWMVVGAGAAKGVVYQTGGELAALPTGTDTSHNTVIGFRGGIGRYEISGGRYCGTANVIVGGMAKEDGPLPAKYTDLATDRKGTGVLKVTGGTFETTKDILVSHGGDGTVEIGAGGVLKAANLRLESATAKLAFVVGDGDTCGKIVLSGTLEAAPGAVIEVDASNLVGYEKVTLVEAGDLSGFDPQRIVVTGDATGEVKPRKVVNRLVVGKTRGSVLIFR